MTTWTSQVTRLHARPEDPRTTHDAEDPQQWIFTAIPRPRPALKEFGAPPRQRNAVAECVRESLFPQDRLDRLDRLDRFDWLGKHASSSSPHTRATVRRGILAQSPQPVGKVEKEACMPTSATLTRTCAVPGCGNRASRSCARCGEARCLDHILPAIDDQIGAVVHFCPTCLEAHNDDRDYEAPRAQRALDIFDRTGVGPSIGDPVPPSGGHGLISGQTADLGAGEPCVSVLAAGWPPVGR